MNFKKWLKMNEVGTSTGSIAGFSRISIPMIRRKWANKWGEEDPFFKKKKKTKENN